MSSFPPFPLLIAAAMTHLTIACFRPLVAALLLLASAGAAPVCLQGPGGFSAGQLYLTSTAFADGGGAGLIRIDPWGGGYERILDFSYAVLSADGIAYDGFRDRLIVHAALSGEDRRLWKVDAAGNAVQLTATLSGSVTNLAPARGGRIYFRQTGSTQNIHYLDAQDQLQVLMDVSGLLPYEISPGATPVVQGMEYHPGTNALFLVGSSFALVCPGGDAQDISVHRLPLSSDGTRVIGPATCAQYDVNPGGASEVPKSLSQGPGGDLILEVDTNNSLTQARILRVDAQSGGLSLYSTTGGFTGHNCLESGVFSHALGRAVAFHGCVCDLRSFSSGGPSSGHPIALGLGSLPSGVSRMTEIFPIALNTGFSADSGQLSLAGGGTQTFQIEAGAANAGNLYLVLGSAAGSAPGLALDGWQLPLNLDGYFVYTLGNANKAPLASSLGLLDGNGNASAAFVLPPGSNPALAGVVFHHAALISNFLVVVQASNAVGLQLQP